MLAEYDVIDDNQFSYMESFECEFRGNLSPKMVIEYSKKRIGKELLRRGVLCSKIEVSLC